MVQKQLFQSIFWKAVLKNFVKAHWRIARNPPPPQASKMENFAMIVSGLSC